MTEEASLSTAPKATDIAQRFEISDAARAKLRPTDTPLELLTTLVSAELWVDAVRFAAYACTKRQAVYWAYLCTRTLDLSSLPAQQQSLDSVQRWLQTPSEEERYLCFTASEAAGLNHPAGCTALAAFWSTGSMAPEDAPPICAPDHLCHHAAACAVMLAAATQPEQAVARYRDFITLAQNILSGKHPC